MRMFTPVPTLVVGILIGWLVLPRVASKLNVAIPS